jgi:hypothetical protein
LSSETHFASLSEEKFVEEALDIIKKANDMNITLRILGGVAVYIHSLYSETAIKLYQKIERFEKGKSKFADLDLIAYEKQRKKVMELFEKKLHFNYDILIKAIFARKRLIYYHPKGYCHVDVFFDKLEFNHDVHFGGRLDLDFPTITLADLVLSKMQIHKINLKDIVDLIILFAGHDVSESQDKETIDGTYIATVLSDDWGFWYDAVHNLETVKEFSTKFHAEGKLTKEECNVVTGRVTKLLKIIDQTPKTNNWLKRAKVGTSKPWYREVEEVIR